MVSVLVSGMKQNHFVTDHHHAEPRTIIAKNLISFRYGVTGCCIATSGVANLKPPTE